MSQPFTLVIAESNSRFGVPPRAFSASPNPALYEEKVPRNKHFLLLLCKKDFEINPKLRTFLETLKSIPKILFS
jgi:hypothetical protein